MNQTANSKNDQPLESWKEIANYLQRDVRTVARWEKNEGLPVHRHEHHRRASVYAFPCEIEAWCAARRPQAESAPPVPLWRRLEAWAALGVGVAALLVITYGPFLNPRDPVAEAADGSMRAEQFWAGDNVDDYSRLSADGKWLSYIDWSTGDLWLHDMTSGAKRLITGRGSWDENRSYPETHALSRDGGHIAYAWVDHDNKKFQLRVGPVPRENETHESKVIFDSPSDETGFIEVFGWLSGSDILFLHTEADTARFLIGNAEQGKATALKSLRWSYPEGVAISPGGAWIAYGRKPDPLAAQHDVHLLAADGSHETSTIEHPADDTPIAWTPDGSHLLFRSRRTGNEALWAVPVENGNRTGAPRLVSPDASLLAGVGLTPTGELYYLKSTGSRDIFQAEVNVSTGALINGGPEARLV